jgi:lipoprotein-anchoring transpeptidase ErfK/SrfK
MSKRAAGALALSLLSAISSPAWAQELPTWAFEIFGRQGGGYRAPTHGERSAPFDEDRRATRARRAEEADVRNGGARPVIAPQAPAVVAFAYEFPANSIVIDAGARKLYFVLPDKQAYEYAISVGREGFEWTGTESVSRKQAWPDWYPPTEMRERDRRLPEKMTGGLKNPLGAMALYLGDTLYRIHGTNDAKSIGRAASSGCFRMLNAQVLHLASLAELGTPVHVVKSLHNADVAAAPAHGE